LLNESFTVYEEGSKLCRPPATLPMLEKLCNRARHTYATYCSNSGGPPTTHSLTLPDDIHDLSAFGGTKGGVVKSPASSPPKGDTPSSDSSPAASGDCSAANSEQSQYGIPYSTCAQDVNGGTQGAPQDFTRSLYMPQEQSMLPSFENRYLVPSGGTQYPPPSQENAHQQNLLVIPPAEENEVDLDAFGYPHQPMQYNPYPRPEQFQDIFVGEDTGVQPPQNPQEDAWSMFVRSFGFPGM